MKHCALRLLLILQVTLVKTAVYSGPCHHEGLVPDPDDPRLYYSCKQVIHTSRSNRSIASFDFLAVNCPPGTAWDDKVRGCRSSKGRTELHCLKESLRRVGTLECEEETLKVLHESLQEHIDAVATRGDARRNFHLSVKDIHLNTRENYAKVIAAVGQNIYPLIVATESDTPALSGVGVTYKVYFRNGTMRKIVPVAPEYELHKSLSHMALGLFSIISPYFRAASSSINWKPQLQEFGSRVTEALYAIPGSGLPRNEQSHARRMLELVDNYLKNCLKSNSVSYQKFHDFATGSLAPLIQQSMEAAAKAQVSATLPALKRLKEEMGEEEWKKTFVLIPTVWPVTHYNVRVQMFRKLMDFKQVNQQVLIAEGVHNEDDARTTLGRIVADRALAQLVFGGSSDKKMKDNVYSVSTRRDLMFSAVEEAADRWCEGEGDWTELKGRDSRAPRCPMAKEFSTMLRNAR